MSVPWNKDPLDSESIIYQNSKHLLTEVVIGARQRSLPGLEDIKHWHQRFFKSVKLPVEYYAGNFRDSDPLLPDLVAYEVGVGKYAGSPASSVPSLMQKFDVELTARLKSLDDSSPQGVPPKSPDSLLRVLETIAFAHCELVRVHPFANGNGRVARLLANHVACRYGLPPFISVKPRPANHEYNHLASLAMEGDYKSAIPCFHHMLIDALNYAVDEDVLQHGNGGD